MKIFKTKRGTLVLGLIALGFFFTAILIFWIISLKLPDFSSFESRVVASSTKIYDRTGEVLLYDVHENIKRTVIPSIEMGSNIKNATVALEDDKFYEHNGIRPLSFLRAVLVNITTGEFTQGGSTLTQQIIKNTLLTKEKTVTRKVKEWVLAVKIEKVLTKEQILEIYLNEAPYGGSIYGVEEASHTYFGKKSSELTITESAYLASLPKAPTYYSPFGKHVDALEERKNFTLKKMLSLGFITEEEYEAAKIEQVVFLPEEETGIKAPHFVFYVREYLEQKYGEDAVISGGLRVTTTLDYEIQEKAEEIVKRKALENEGLYDANNGASVVLDSRTGEILSMVGSRDYFDEVIDGKFNVATATRQPGSAFKPIIYATAFKEGYSPETILFDVKTEFQTTCDFYGNPKPGASAGDCYSPQNYDNAYRGPMTIKDALAQSINIPAVKALYLVGINDAIKTAREMGIKTLTDPSRYGLTLVIGGGEVKLLDLTNAYSVFANNGKHTEPVAVLKVENISGEVLEEIKDFNSSQVIPENSAYQISDILSDNNARVPTFGRGSVLEIPGHSVAVKTGTTNNNKDAWTVGYTPSYTIGVWVGNNDNKPMKKGGVGLAGPIWNEITKFVVSKKENEVFPSPSPLGIESKPVLRGYWQGGDSYLIDKISGRLATEYTPEETIDEIVITNVHTILHWVEKTNPAGPSPINPSSDSQYDRWEFGVRDWWEKNKYKYPVYGEDDVPNGYDNIHVPENFPSASFKQGSSLVVGANELTSLELDYSGKYPFQKADYFFNNSFVASVTNKNYSFVPSSITGESSFVIKAVVYDSVFNKTESVIEITLE